jgi:TfoX/Sxy family transcriptional regulator of competence genes
LVDFVRSRLGVRFDFRKMFGEYAIYAEGKVVALICDDRVYVKVHEATAPLAGAELAPPYPGAKPHYVIEEGMLADPALGKLLLRLAQALPQPKTPRRKKD